MKVKAILMALATGLIINSTAHSYPTAQITIKVVDESATPMEGIEAEITYRHGRDKYVSEKGLTGMDGKFTASSENLVDDVAFGIRKDGYYESVGRYRFTMPKSGLSASRWLPWNPEVTLVMRKIENPVAMWARQADIEIPEIGKEFGFDLIEYDWVIPYGRGKQADFIFNLDKEFKSRDEFDGILTVTFPKKFDGIQMVKEDRKYGSRFKLPRFAPDKGYQSKLTHFKKRVPGKPIQSDYASAPLDDNSYIFRIRSEEKDGKLVRAMYGKIHGEIRFDPMMSKTAFILFKYYLNPDYTRNLEFDPTKNLFKGLGSTEQVGLE